MLNYKKIIDKLSVKQKISLLTNVNCLSNSEFTSLGIPYTSLSTIEDILLRSCEGVSSNILARSWNIDSLREITEELVQNAKENGTNFVIAPSPKIKFNPYSSAISEDPYLAGEIVGAYLSAIHLAGVPACISGFRLESDDVDYLDLEPSKRIVYEYFIAPFRIAAKQGDCHTVMASVSGPGNGYGDANLKLMLSAESGLFHVNMNVLCDEHTPEATAEVWHAGGIVMSGVATVLEHAYEKYKQIVKAIHEGHATVNDLEDAYADGSAISDEMMDAAVSRVIDFAFMCKIERGETLEYNNSDHDPSAVEEAFTESEIKEYLSAQYSYEDSNDASIDESFDDEVIDDTENIESSEASEQEEMNDSNMDQVQPDPHEEIENLPPKKAFVPERLLDSLRESIVLLKNDNSILPIKSGSKLAFIGDAAISEKGENFAVELASMIKTPCVGITKGYALNNDKNESFFDNALKLASAADIVFLFLEIDSRRKDKISLTKHLELPANQAALLEALKPYSHKLVAVVGGDILPAASFDKDVSALLLAPIGGQNCVRALAEVVTGIYNPSGRLTESYYDYPCETFEKIKLNKDTKRNKIGPFIGYRNYDSSSSSIRYPFGFGLSYTEFKYSDIVVYGKKVSFTLRNTGERKGTETVQVFVGKKDSQYIRPYRELKAFKRVELNPGEATRVEITVSDLSIFDEDKNQFIVEGGAYEIYVGSSLNDIKLVGEMHAECASKANDLRGKESSADYLQSESNILLDNYTLETRGKKMKRSHKWMVGYIIGLVFAAIINAVLIITKIGLDDDYSVLGRVFLATIVVFNIFAISFIVFAIIKDSISIKKFRQLKMKQELESINERFSDAILLEELDIDKLFVKEFDDVFNKEMDAKPRPGFDLSDYSRFVDDEMNFVVAHRALIDHASNNNISLAEDMPGNLLAAFATSRLLLLNSANDDYTRRFTGVLAQYFGTEEYFEQLDNSFIDGNLLIVKTGEDAIRHTAITKMIKSAQDHKEKIHFVTLTNMTSDLLTNLFARYIRYLNNPERECVVSVNDEKYTIPENVWFLVSMKDGENIQSIPVYMAELITTLNVNYSDKSVFDSSYSESMTNTEEQRDLLTLGYYQLSFMGEKAKKGFLLSEDLWKKVDSLEEYANKHSSYRFGNKLWLRLEKYLAVLSSCEFESIVALDNTLNSNLVHVLQIVLDGKLQDDDRGLLEALELFFGEDSVPACRKTLKGVTLM